MISRIPVGARPDALAVTPDGSELYVPGRGSGSVSVMDARTNSVVADIPVEPSPRWVDFSRDGTLAYSANESSNLVSVIDTASRTVVTEIPVQALRPAASPYCPMAAARTSAVPAAGRSP